MNPTQVNQETTAAQKQGAALQSQYNQQAAQQYGAYQGAQNQANQAYGNLQNYNKSMANPQDLYNQALTGAQQMYGFNPQDLLKANQALANTNTTIANLPQAIQQQGNYYGTTAGSEANNYANQAGNLQNVLAGQSNTANAFQNVLAATQNQANQSAQLGLQGEQLKSQNYAQLYTNALGQMQTAGQVLNQLQTLQQQQGNLTAQQVAAYRNAYSSYVQASAAAQLATAQSKQINQQVQMVNTLSQTMAKIYGGQPQQYATALTQMLTGNSNMKLPASATAPGAPKANPAGPDPFTQFSESFVNNTGNLLGNIGGGLDRLGSLGYGG